LGRAGKSIIIRLSIKTSFYAHLLALALLHAITPPSLHHYLYLHITSYLLALD
jgi:hypothetical protein